MDNNRSSDDISFDSSCKQSIFKKHPICAINFIWVICLLIAIIIGLLTYIVQCTLSADVLISAITNFSTILSIFLSISSILFAYYTSRDTGAQYSYMHKALEEVRSYNKAISENNHSLLNSVHEIALKVATLNEKIDLKNLISNNNQIIADPKTGMNSKDIPSNL